MKNILIALLATYVFWTDVAVIHPLPALPLLFVTLLFIISGIDELIADYKHTIRNGQRLQRRIKRMEREVY